MIAMRSLRGYQNFLMGLIVLFIYLNPGGTEAIKKGVHPRVANNQRLFLYMRSGNVQDSDYSIQLAKQFEIDLNVTQTVKSDRTLSQPIKNQPSSIVAAVGNETFVIEKPARSSQNMGVPLPESEQVADLYNGLSSSQVTVDVTQDPQIKNETLQAAQQGNVEEAKNSSSEGRKGSSSLPPKKNPSKPEGALSTQMAKKNETFSDKFSSQKEDQTSASVELLATNSPSSSSPNRKVVSKPKAPPPEFQLLSQCGCRRNFFYGIEDFSDTKLNSSCSDEGTQYVPGQKVVSFSLPRATSPGDYNRTSTYQQNIVDNLQLMHRFYPGYSMRLYTDLSLDNTYCRFLCQNTDLFWCDIRNSIGGDQSKMLHATWKFLPLGDPTVKLFLSRDISSSINEREAAVVQDWLQLNKTFHLMRDKRRVHNFAMLGGLWGARNDLLGEEGDKLRAQIIPMSKAPRNKGYRTKNFDQDILSRVIFYPRKRDIVAYDSYHCKQWKKFTIVRPFPVQRNQTTLIQGLNSATNARRGGSASSAVAAIKKKYKLLKCPIECRPSYGKDWEYC